MKGKNLQLAIEKFEISLSLFLYSFIYYSHWNEGLRMGVVVVFRFCGKHVGVASLAHRPTSGQVRRVRRVLTQTGRWFPAFPLLEAIFCGCIAGGCRTYAEMFWLVYKVEAVSEPIILRAFSLDPIEEEEIEDVWKPNESFIARKAQSFVDKVKEVKCC